MVRQAPMTLVLELKAILRESYPTEPAESSQTLIHAGRVVKDGSPLKDVISKVCGVCVVFATCVRARCVHACRNAAKTSCSRARSARVALPSRRKRGAAGQAAWRRRRHRCSSGLTSVASKRSTTAKGRRRST